MIAKAELMERRSALLEKLAAVKSDLAAVEDEIRSLSLTACGVKEGDKVRYKPDGAMGVVCKIDLWAYDRHGGKPWVTVHLFKKNGSLGLRERCFYDRWEHVTEEQL
jgi:hypothetical protein